MSGTRHSQLSGLMSLAVPSIKVPVPAPAADTCGLKAAWAMKGKIEATSWTNQ